MSASSLALQLLNGLAGASSLFLIAAGLSLIFGVTRIVNFAHGSLYMLGLYLAWSLVRWLGHGVLGFWSAVLVAALAVGLLGAVTEIVLLRRIYRAPELFQLLATFALVLLVRDGVHFIWGPEDLLGPRAPGLEGSISVLGRAFPQYDLLLICVAPLVLLLLWLLLARTRWGILVRAATQDREMVGALGVDQAWLFTSVFALGALLAGLGGALQLPREPASLELDMITIVDAFVVVVVGGMGSIPGAFLAALLIGELKAIFIGIGHMSLLGVDIAFSRLVLAIEFLVMAAVLIWRPWGLLGRDPGPVHESGPVPSPVRAASRGLRLLGIALVAVLALVPLAAEALPYATILLGDMLVAALFAASLHFMLGPAGMLSFGHAAFFGLGAYGAGLLLRRLGLPMELALALGPLAALFGGMVAGWFAVRLSGVYLAMVTLAFAQIVWSIAFQWESVTGGSNGLIGIWPSDWLAEGHAYYWLSLLVTVLMLWLLRRLVHSPFGYAMRATRDSPLRAESIGIDVARIRWLVFVIAAGAGGVAGALYAFSKGSISPDVLSIERSVDALVMVLLGGVEAAAGPLVGATSFTWLQDELARETGYWRALLGAIILLLVLLFPGGIAGALRRRLPARDVAP